MLKETKQQLDIAVNTISIQNVVETHKRTTLSISHPNVTIWMFLIFYVFINLNEETAALFYNTDIIILFLCIILIL